MRRYIKYMIENGIRVIFRLAYKPYKYQLTVTTVNFLCMLLHVTERSFVKWPSMKGHVLTRFGVRLPLEATDYSHLQDVKTYYPYKPPIQRVPGGVTPCIKWPERKAGHSPPSSSEVKTERNCISTPRIFSHGTAEGHHLY